VDGAHAIVINGAVRVMRLIERKQVTLMELLGIRWIELFVVSWMEHMQVVSRDC
jgi:hypothetical protein